MPLSDNRPHKMFTYTIHTRPMLFRSKDFFPAMAFLLVIMLVVLMFSNTGYVPYTKNEMFPKHGMYEGFVEGAEEDKEDEEAKKESSEGFQTVLPRLEPGLSSVEAEVLDKFTKITKNSDKNDPNCYSAGLSNSKGALCLSPELINLLKTRGGNM